MFTKLKQWLKVSIPHLFFFFYEYSVRVIVGLFGICSLYKCIALLSMQWFMYAGIIEGFSFDSED